MAVDSCSWSPFRRAHTQVFMLTQFTWMRQFIFSRLEVFVPFHPAILPVLRFWPAGRWRCQSQSDSPPLWLQLSVIDLPSIFARGYPRYSQLTAHEGVRLSMKINYGGSLASVVFLSGIQAITSVHQLMRLFGSFPAVWLISGTLTRFLMAPAEAENIMF